MLYLSMENQSYPPEIMQAFQEGNIKNVLNKYLYDYRNHTDDGAFHFLIGLCMYRLGYYEEAHVAFQRSQQFSKAGYHKGTVFDSLVLLMAQKDSAAISKLDTIPLAELDASEVVTVMSIKNQLKMPVDKELKQVLNSSFKTEADRLVMSVFALKYAGLDKDAENMAMSLNKDLFLDFKTYMFVIEELRKLHMNEVVDSLLEKINRKEIAEDATMFKDYLKTCYSCGFYNRMKESARFSLFMYVKNYHKTDRDIWEKNLSALYCMEYDRLEQSDPSKRAHLVKKMKKVKEEYRTEQLLLYITTYDFEHFDTCNREKLKENLEKLITMNQTSRRYRKLYHNLLIVMGFLRQADEVTKATIDMRKKEEAEEFSLIYKFHSFYMPKNCMMKYSSAVHEHDDGADCPICFGSGYQPIIRAIGAGHSSSSIFTDNFETRTIEPNEAMLRDLVKWQPMNVASPIIAKYLLSLGAYMSAREYPDVLVPGQTYLYLSLKPEAEKRLLSEGYSMLQINPFVLAMDEKGATTDVSGKTIKDLPVSAKDFTLEIIHAISPKEDFDKAPEMPIPEQYEPTKYGE